MAKQTYVAVSPEGDEFQYDSLSMFNNLKRLHAGQGVLGWAYGPLSDLDTLRKSTKAGMNLKNAELIGEKYELKSQLSEKERSLQEKDLEIAQLKALLEDAAKLKGTSKK